VRTQTPCLALCFHRTAFLGIVTRFPMLREGLKRFMEHCTSVNLKALAIPLLQALPHTVLDSVAKSIVFCSLLPGEVLFSQGDKDDTAYILSQVGDCVAVCLFRGVTVAAVAVSSPAAPSHL
jgi:CRP-like cAMP-binding protein